MVDDVTVNGGFSTLLLLKLLILINLYVIFCQIGKIYHLRFPPKKQSQDFGSTCSTTSFCRINFPFSKMPACQQSQYMILLTSAIIFFAKKIIQQSQYMILPASGNRLFPQVPPFNMIHRQHKNPHHHPKRKRKALCQFVIFIWRYF